MRAVRSKDTKPEMLVRRMVHAMGYRFRLHRKDLPGKPDLVFPGRRSVVFVHGCFWHSHDCPKGQHRPATNREFWDEKLDGNRARDAKVVEALAQGGWRILTIWECEMRDRQAIEERLKRFLG